jgi:hypothetical protein
MTETKFFGKRVLTCTFPKKSFVVCGVFELPLLRNAQKHPRGLQKKEKENKHEARKKKSGEKRPTDFSFFFF